MKIAIVHDFLNQYGGAERVIEALHVVYPDAPIYTSIYLSDNLPESFKKMDIRTSFMQKLPFLKKHFKKYLPLYPMAFESFNLKEYDIILSSSSAFAKGVQKATGACHVCYCYTPMRFAWDYDNYIAKECFGNLERQLLPFVISKLKKWDLETKDRVDHYIAISDNIRKRIKRCYGRDSSVIYPPVNTGNFKIARKVGDSFLVVSRLNAYKQIDIVINAFNGLKLPLKIIGDGPARKSLERSAASNIQFLGKVDDIALAEHYAQCRAFIFPGEEDFGIAPVEAQAAGRPVIAYAAGGALETVIEGVTGVFFHEPNSESVAKAVRRLMEIERSFEPRKIRENAIRFDRAIFMREIKEYIHNLFSDVINSSGG